MSMSKGKKLNGMCGSSEDHSNCRFISFTPVPTSTNKLKSIRDTIIPARLKGKPLFSNSFDLTSSTPNNNKLKYGSSRSALGSLKEFGDFELIEMLGNGFFGTVWKVRERKDESMDPGCEILVMKIPIRHKQLCHHSAKQIAIKEDSMLRLLKHPNIIRSRGIVVQRTDTFWQLNLLIDYCDGGSLQQLITNNEKSFPWLYRYRVALDVCNAINYVHGEGFMHRDLTSMNVLLQTQPQSKFMRAIVADFGLSERIPKFPKKLEQVGSQNWMAPEVLKEEFYNEKADVFSFGIILCQMIARIDADHDAGLFRTIEFGLDCESFRNKFLHNVRSELMDIAFLCCKMDYNSRPSFDLLCKLFRSILENEVEECEQQR